MEIQHSDDPEILGIEIKDVDLKDVDQAAADHIKAMVHEHTLARFKHQSMSIEEYLAFGKKLGTMMPYHDKRYRHEEYEDVFVSSNVRSRTMGMARSGYFWHTDLSFMPQPQPITVLYPQVLPEAKRETLFINMANVYDALPQHLREAVEGRTAKHDPVLRYKLAQEDVDANLDIGEVIAKGRKMCPAPTHPCVFTHPVTGRKLLYMNEGFTTSIDGLSHEESQAVLEELFEFIRRPEHVQRHSWELGDIILWDNRMLIHRAGFMAPTDFQTIFRLGVDDGVPFYEGIAAA